MHLSAFDSVVPLFARAGVRVLVVVARSGGSVRIARSLPPELECVCYVSLMEKQVIFSLFTKAWRDTASLLFGLARASCRVAVINDVFKNISRGIASRANADHRTLVFLSEVS